MCDRHPSLGATLFGKEMLCFPNTCGTETLVLLPRIIVSPIILNMVFHMVLYSQLNSVC